MIEKEFEKQQKNIKGYDEQEILVELLSTTISKISGMSSGTLGLHIKQSLTDVLEKRHTSFKKIKTLTNEEKGQFVHDLIIMTIKRAKLVGSVDRILAESEKAYDEWKKKYRPEEM